MNERSQLHRSKNNQPNRRSTHCRTDDTLAADGVSHSDSHPPPATRGCHPPPEVLSPTFAPLHAAKPHLHLCTVSLPPHVPMPPCQHVPSRLRRALVNVSTCQPVPSRKRLSPCHLAHVPPRDLWSRSGKFWFSDLMVRPDPVFGTRYFKTSPTLISA